MIRVYNECVVRIVLFIIFFTPIVLFIHNNNLSQVFEFLEILFTLPLFLLLLYLLKHNHVVLDAWVRKIDYFIEHRISYLVFILIFSMGATLLLFGNNLKAQWGVIDDHEMFAYLGSDKILTIQEYFPTIFHDTELRVLGEISQGSQITVARFRPFYYPMRVLETLVWGADVKLWYAFRLFLLFIAIALFTDTLRIKLGILGSPILAANALAFGYWGDIFGRLGPGEIYTVPGLAMFLWGFCRILKEIKGTQTRNTYWWTMVVGAITCIGSKENFLLLLLPLIYLAKKMFEEKEHSTFSIISLLAIFCFWLFETVVLAIMFSQSKVDVYNNAVSPVARVNAFFEQLMTQGFLIRGIPILFMMLVFLGLVIAWIAKRGFNISKEKAVAIKTALIFLGIIQGLYFSQLYFYNWFWPTYSHYDFPGLFYIPAFEIIFFLFLPGLLDLPPSDGKNPVDFRAAFLLTLLLAIFFKGYSPIINMVNRNVQVTNRFQANLQYLTEKLNSHPEYAIIMESYDVYDFEPIGSFERYFQANGIRNPIFLRLDHSESEKRLGNETLLSSEMQKWARDGDGRLIAPAAALGTRQSLIMRLPYGDIIGAVAD